jgi:heme-degrading monooxygenase HmoA
MYVIVWRFTCRAGKSGDFERIYGPRGDWARLFALGSGFLGTELLKSSGESFRYMTIDRWARLSDFEAFKSRWTTEYRALDEKCSELTDSEESIGAFNSEA